MKAIVTLSSYNPTSMLTMQLPNISVAADRSIADIQCLQTTPDSLFIMRNMF